MSDEGKEIIRELVASSASAPPPGHFVTREEFIATIATIESKIENAVLKQKQWVLTGVISILLGGGAGYVSLVSKLDRLTETLPVIAKVQEDRTPWIQRQEQRDALQDEVLKKLDRTYQPLPYAPPPQ